MAKTSLCHFLESGKLNGNSLVLTPVKKVTTGYYIVGDSSGLAVLEHNKNGKEIKIGTTFKLIKPLRVNDTTLKCHPNFSPVKTNEKVNISPSKEEIELIESKVNIGNEELDENKTYLNFESIKKMSPASIIPNVTFLVTNVSRIIQTKSGQYQICGLKDIDSKKISMNLYDKYMNKLEVGKVFTATKVKKL